MQWDTTVDANDNDGTPREVFGLQDNTPDAFNYSAVMRAAEATDDSGGPVEYYFWCVTRSGFSSGWQAEPSYTVYIGQRGLSLVFRVKARDEYGNETDYSPPGIAD
jgi:hypothetical protein